MSKDCDHHKKKRKKLIRKILVATVAFFFILLLTILIIWAILRPTKPKFIIQDATVYAFNLSAPNLFTSTFLLTISSRNPNDKIGIYYDNVHVYAVYRNQQITFRTIIPPTYQDHKDVNVWSPYVSGVSVPIAPYNVDALNQDRAAGIVPLLIKINGRVRWKVGAFISGRYHLHVNCPAVISFGNPAAGIVVDHNAVKYQLVQRCSVSV